MATAQPTAHLKQRQGVRGISDDDIRDLLTTGTKVPLGNNRSAVYGNGLVLIIDESGPDPVAVTTFWQFRVGLVVVCPPDRALEVIAMVNEHIASNRSFARSLFSRDVGANIVGVIALDGGVNPAEKPAQDLIPAEFKDFTGHIQPQWGGDCGYNPDWLSKFTEATPPERQLLSAVELPSPAHGYPNLDVLGTVTQVRSSTKQDAAHISRTVQQRTLVESGIAIHESFLSAGTITPGGQTVVTGQDPINVLFLRVDLPEDVQVLNLTMDADMTGRLQSYYAGKIVPADMAFVAVVPPGFNQADTSHFDAILPPNPTPDSCLICRDCSSQFVFTFAQQKEAQDRGHQPPKSCKACRDKRKKK